MGCPVMESKLLQPKNYCPNQSRKVVDYQHENIEDSSTPRKGHQPPSNPDNPAVDAQARKDFPRLLKHGYRSARS
jgi:hypothetical protein